jgi:hypothetical protein
MSAAPCRTAGQVPMTRKLLHVLTPAFCGALPTRPKRLDWCPSVYYDWFDGEPGRGALLGGRGGGGGGPGVQRVWARKLRKLHFAGGA